LAAPPSPRLMTINTAPRRASVFDTPLARQQLRASLPRLAPCPSINGQPDRTQ
jgi:hypothetical protein